MGRAFTRTEMETHLSEQIEFLKSSANAFDAGAEIEAKRLAVHIRTLLHDTKRSQSLFDHLGMKGVKFFDSAFEFDAENPLSHSGLTLTHQSAAGWKHIAPLDDTLGPPSQQDFDTWWNSPVFVDSSRRAISRKMLVLNAANKDGGAHVDAELEETYDDLSRNNSLGQLSFDGQAWKALPGPERAAIRQIAHELLKTIDPAYTKAVEREGGLTFGGMKINTISMEEAAKRGLHPPSKSSSKLGAMHFGRKVGRNETCPCESGRKFKHCHGKLV